jgi:hypothetical protein
MPNSKPPRKAQQQRKSNLQLGILEWWDASGETYMPYLLATRPYLLLFPFLCSNLHPQNRMILKQWQFHEAATIRRHLQDLVSTCDLKNILGSFNQSVTIDGGNPNHMDRHW